MFYQNRGNKNESFGGDLEPELNLALTLHPVKRSPYVYRLQNFFNLKNLVRLKYTANQLEREIRSMDGKLNKASSSHRWNVAHNARSSRRADDDGDVSSDFARDEVWNFVRSNLIYARTHPYQNPYESVVRRGRQLRINATLTVLKRHDASMRKPVFYYEKISTGIGVEHVVAFGNKTFYKPFVSLQRFQAPEIVEVPVRGFAGEVIHMILPVYRRPKTFYNFLRSLNTTAHSFRGKIHLRIVMYQDCFNEHLVSLRHYISFNCKCSNLETELFQLVGPFSKVKAMNKGTEGLPPDALLLFMDLDMIYTASFLDRVVLNTKRGKHAFFPISFSQYNPDTLCVGRKDCSFNRLSFDVYQDRGTWRHFGFGIVGIYKDDFFRVGGWDLTIMGWGKEDTLFYEDCFSYGFPVFRSIEPGLVHVHHIKYCNVTLPTDQLNMCLASRVEMYASQAVLADIAYNMPAVKENRDKNIVTDAKI